MNMRSLASRLSQSEQRWNPPPPPPRAAATGSPGPVKISNISDEGHPPNPTVIGMAQCDACRVWQGDGILQLGAWGPTFSSYPQDCLAPDTTPELISTNKQVI